MPTWPEEAFPTIERIVQCPYFTREGTLVAQPGYNVSTKVWYDPGKLIVPAVSEVPTDDDVERAKKTLMEDYLGDFPFQGDPDKANALAFLLTPFVRLMVGLVPMLILEAPTAGTGKGLLMKCVVLPALGMIPAMTPQPESEAEWKKSITAILVKLPPFITWDNLTGMLKWTSSVRC